MKYYFFDCGFFVVVFFYEGYYFIFLDVEVNIVNGFDLKIIDEF